MKSNNSEAECEAQLDKGFPPHRNPAPQSRKLIEHVQPSHMAVDLEGVEGIVIQNQALEVCIIAQARKNLNLTKHQLTM